MQQRASIVSSRATASGSDIAATAATAGSIQLPSAPTSGSKRKRKSTSSGYYQGLSHILCGAIAVLLFLGVVAWRYWASEWESRDALLREGYRIQQEQLTEKWHEKLRELQDEVKSITEERDGLLGDQEREEKLRKDAEQLEEKRDEKTKGQIEYFKNYRARMHKGIQAMSRRFVLEKFGPGPHRVEILLAFHPDEPGVGTADRIVLELAPLDEMPHAIYVFLSQVSSQLWNGCSFHRNAQHVLQAGTAPSFATPPDSHLPRRFREAGLESIVFQEYSPTFPHLPLTIGFAGRPGGPDFYISLEDNSLDHGPGGQASYSDASEADPCFGKVVEGEDAVWRMHGLAKVKGDGFEGLVRPVAILEMNVLTTVPQQSR